MWLLTNTGVIFRKLHHHENGWERVALPPGCKTGPPEVPVLTSTYQDPPLPTHNFEVPPSDLGADRIAQAERKINLDVLPPKLRSVLTDGGGSSNICPQCGLAMKAGRCVECEITPAGGGNYDT